MASAQRSTTIPITPLLELYWRAKQLSTQDLLDRLASDNDVATFAEEIADAFSSTIKQLSAEYDAPEKAFRPAARNPAKGDIVDEAEEATSSDEIRIARDVATALHRAGGLHVAGREDPTASYVDYEVSVLRTLGGATFAQASGHAKSGQPSGRALVADLLLRGAGDVPVIGEVKLRGDTSPVLGAIQVLAYVAHLAPERQYRRLSIAPSGGKRKAFRAYDATNPLFHALVLVVDGPEDGKAGKVAALHHAAPKFVAALKAEPSIAAVVDQFEILRLDLPEGKLAVDGVITATPVSVR